MTNFEVCQKPNLAIGYFCTNASADKPQPTPLKPKPCLEFRPYFVELIVRSRRFFGDSKNNFAPEISSLIPA